MVLKCTIKVIKRDKADSPFSLALKVNKFNLKDKFKTNIKIGDNQNTKGHKLMPSSFLMVWNKHLGISISYSHGPQKAEQNKDGQWTKP